jgi:SAM-dependent methyltransferase
MAGEALDANAEQRSYWNTVAGPRWVAAPGFRERRNQESMALLLARLGDIAGQSVLEIGCGTGAMTLPIATAVGEHGRVVAVDISEPMLGAARQRVGERGLGNVTLLLGDAQVFDFEPAAFDLATSRMGVMFFADPAAAFRNIGGALKPGGPLVFACWAPLAENRHWLISYDVAPLGPAGAAARSRARPARLRRPRLYSRVSRGGRLRRDHGRTGSPDDHRRQPRGRGAAGDNDGTNGKTDRGEGARRGDAADDRARDRSGVRRGSRFRPDPAAGDHLSGHCPPPRLT